MNDFFEDDHPVLDLIVVIVASIVGSGIGIFLAALVMAMRDLGWI